MKFWWIYRPSVALASMNWLETFGIPLVQSCEIDAAGGVKREEFSRFVPAFAFLGTQEPFQLLGAAFPGVRLILLEKLLIN